MLTASVSCLKAVSLASHSHEAYITALLVWLCKLFHHTHAPELYIHHALLNFLSVAIGFCRRSHDNTGGSWVGGAVKLNKQLNM